MCTTANSWTMRVFNAAGVWHNIPKSLLRNARVHLLQIKRSDWKFSNGEQRTNYANTGCLQYTRNTGGNDMTTWRRRLKNVIEIIRVQTAKSERPLFVRNARSINAGCRKNVLFGNFEVPIEKRLMRYFERIFFFFSFLL